MLLLPAEAQPVPPEAALRFSERRTDGEVTLVVENAFYEATVRPQRGATISSLRFGTEHKRELTSWEQGDFAGLLQEVHTADLPFEVVEKEIGPDRVSLACEGACAGFVVRKVFEFRRGDPTIKVTMVFENRSASPVGGSAAPCITNVILPAGGESTGREYYCLDRGGGAEALTSATVLGQLSPVGGNDGILSWLAVSESVTQNGLGVVFLDAAARRPSAQRNHGGEIAVRWRYGPLPARSRMRTQLLLVPLQGFAAVSAISPDFVVDTVVEAAPENGRTVSLRLMPLRADMTDVSVVTRVYGADGTELEPCDTMLLDRLVARKCATRKVALSRQAREPAWLHQELYREGRRVAQFVVPLDPASAAPRAKSDLPPAPIEPLTPPPVEDPGGQEEAGDGHGFVVSLLHGEVVDPEAGPMRIALASREKETLFFFIRSAGPIERLRASLGAGVEDTRPIAPTAAYLWSVEADRDGPPRTVPFEEKRLQPDTMTCVAVTLDAGELAAGSYSTRLFIRGDRGAWELPIIVTVFPRRLGSSEGFALWFIDAQTSAGDIDTATLLKLRDHTVGALSVMPDSRTPGSSAISALQRVEACRLDMLSFHAPGAGTAAADRTAREGLCAALLPTPRVGWLLWAGTDGLGGIGRLSALGFEPAVVFSRMPEPGKAPQEAPTHWLVEDGCPLDVVPGLVDQGRIQPGGSVWVYLDLAESDWRRAAMELRGAFWTAAWQGLAGAAVHCPRPLKSVDQQCVLWHVLRDAREEAALAALALQKGEMLARTTLDGDAANLERALALEELRRLIGRRDDCLVRIEAVKVPFRTLPRATAGQSPVRGFQTAKAHALDFLARAEELSPKPRPWANVYWRGIPMLEDERIRWAIAAGPGVPATAAKALQESMETRTGRTVPILPESPRLEAGAGELPRLLWLIVADMSAEALPPALRAAGGDCRLRVMDLRADATVVALCAEADVQALQRTFLAESTLYRPAARVK